MSIMPKVVEHGRAVVLHHRVKRSEPGLEAPLTIETTLRSQSTTMALPPIAFSLRAPGRRNAYAVLVVSSDFCRGRWYAENVCNHDGMRLLSLDRDTDYFDIVASERSLQHGTTCTILTDDDSTALLLLACLTALSGLDWPAIEQAYRTGREPAGAEERRLVDLSDAIHRAVRTGDGLPAPCGAWTPSSRHAARSELARAAYASGDIPQFLNVVRSGQCRRIP